MALVNAVIRARCSSRRELATSYYIVPPPEPELEQEGLGLPFMQTEDVEDDWQRWAPLEEGAGPSDA